MDNGQERTTRVVVVGAGGLLYHSLPSLATLLNGYMGKDCLKLVVEDPDVVEEKNVTRQWGKVGFHKSWLAVNVFENLCPRLDEEEDPSDLYSPVRRVVQRNLRRRNTEERLVVLCLPDNHLTRVQVHKELWREGQKGGQPVWGVFAGNDLHGGWCLVCRYTQEGKIEWDWGWNYPDILEEALKEMRGEAQAEGCGRRPEGSAGQTLVGNKLTGVCMVQGLLSLLVLGRGGDWRWDYDQKEHRFSVYNRITPPFKEGWTGDYLQGLPKLPAVEEEAPLVGLPEVETENVMSEGKEGAACA